MRATVKGAFRSKTIWFGAAVMIGTWLSQNTDLIQSFIPDRYDELAGYFIGIMIWVLRYITTEPLQEKAIDTKKTHPPTKKPTASDVLNNSLNVDNDLKDF